MTYTEMGTYAIKPKDFRRWLGARHRIFERKEPSECPISRYVRERERRMVSSSQAHILVTDAEERRVYKVQRWVRDFINLYDSGISPLESLERATEGRRQ